MRVLDLFSGIGGFSLGLERAGMKTVAFCEIDPRAQAVIKAHWPQAPLYNDVKWISRHELARDLVCAPDLICGGFPCQDASVANIGGAGALGPRTGLFRQAVRVAAELDCPLLMENVPELLNRGFGDVLGALAQIGFDAEWDCISAREAGAPHKRERLWILAYPSGSGWQGLEPHNRILGRARQALAQHGDSAFGTWDALVGGEPLLRGGDGLSVGLERARLHGLGNAVVPQITEAIGRAILTAEGART
jgi:DNA (cytosine-5)-methyltransferase 1